MFYRQQRMLERYHYDKMNALGYDPDDYQNYPYQQGFNGGAILNYGQSQARVPQTLRSDYNLLQKNFLETETGRKDKPKKKGFYLPGGGPFNQPFLF